MKLSNVFFALALLCGPAFAWNCSDPLAERVDVGTSNPAGSTAGDGDGQYFIGTGSEGVKGDYYVCTVVKPGTHKASSIKNTNNSTNTNDNTNSNTNTNANSNVNNVTTTVSNNASQKQQQQQSQSQTATGGNASSTSSATGGNANATGGNATSNGDNSNNTTVEASKIPVNTAYAPTALPTVPCFKGYGGGVQLPQFGASVGGGKIDENCARLEAARSLGISGSWLAYCKVMVTNKYVKEAGVTVEDCLKRYVPPAPVIIQATAPAPVVVPAPPLPAPPIVILLQSIDVTPTAAERAAAAKLVPHKKHVRPTAKVPCVPDSLRHPLEK